VRSLSTVDSSEGISTHAIDANVPLATRRQIAYVATVAQRSISGDWPGYDGTIDEDDQRLFVAASADRVVAMVVTALDGRFWPLGWRADGSIELRGERASLRQGHKIARVWTAANFRRRGLALRLIQIASRALSIRTEDFGWEIPFTAGGTLLVKRLCPESFWGCGSPYSLNETLNQGLL
jgi:hypothetical protein